MELACPGFTAVNVGSNFEHPEDVHEYFSLQAPPNTSIWRKPAASDDTSAPMVLKRLQQAFILAEVTVSADFAMEYDQAGLVIFAGSLPAPSLPRSPPTIRRSPRYSRPGTETLATGKWAKAGLEFSGGELHATSVVAISPCGADWSSSARMPSPSSTFDPYSLTSQSLRLKFERVDESLWIWYQIPHLNSPPLDYYQTSAYDPEWRSPEDVGSGWKKMREIMGFFGGAEQKGNVWVGCYASRPMDFEPSNSWEEVDGLVAEFEDLEIL
ncbi:uncharacterized protein Z518_05411 [Rhinocladiella mackenziei CBS 650.93]|uniref:Uncharacterized protein n=1 Tax=Rhinocladiella mackenziei CBS 650.93 TaxID=1442369 RepID=A0A0D2IN49_9EURO|nr:uncharacterized protein Z518_05411 [Rhinocladiella mackenziei CBS 650.93]KIX04541.1 hypothetical protein Z518_05411 [Rhinocladiella mackenziei CBS 650.93]